MTVIQQQHAIDCHLSGSASVVEVLLSFLLDDMNIINAVKNRKPKNSIHSTKNITISQKLCFVRCLIVQVFIYGYRNHVSISCPRLGKPICQ